MLVILVISFSSLNYEGKPSAENELELSDCLNEYVEEVLRDRRYAMVVLLSMDGSKLKKKYVSCI